jgi:hypothetical protein
VVNGQLESIFEVAEELSKFGWAGVEWESFRPEDCTAREAVFQVFRKLISIS